MAVTHGCDGKHMTRTREGLISSRSWQVRLETQEVHRRSSRNFCMMNDTSSQMLRLTRTSATGFASSSTTSLQRLLAKFWSSSHPENSHLLYTSPRLHLSTSPGLTTLATTIWYVPSTIYRPNRLHSTSSLPAFSRAVPTLSARCSPD